MNKEALQHAFVLHQRPYRESSALVDIFSADYGLLRVVVRGVKGSSKSASLRRSVVQEFNEIAISWGGKSALKTAHNIELVKSYQLLNQQQLYAGLYLNELMLRLASANEACDSLYQVYRDSVLHLEAIDIQAQRMQQQVEVVLRRFEMRLLQTLGFAIDFSSCADNGELVEHNKHYSYLVDRGFIAQEQPESAINKPSNIDAGFIPGEVLLALNNNDFEAAITRRYSKRIMRLALAQQLGGKPLKSRALYR
jgi:DNA repair protein RecO (recombination protein O)